MLIHSFRTTNKLELSTLSLKSSHSPKTCFPLPITVQCCHHGTHSEKQYGSRVARKASIAASWLGQQNLSRTLRSQYPQTARQDGCFQKTTTSTKTSQEYTGVQREGFSWLMGYIWRMIHNDHMLGLGQVNLENQSKREGGVKRR